MNTVVSLAFALSGIVVGALLTWLLLSLRSARRGSAATSAAVDKVVRPLREEIRRFDLMLHNPQKRGAWAERHMRNLADVVGMAEHVDFEVQLDVVDQTTGKPHRLDMVVTLPEGAKVVIDSKFPLDSYRRAIEASDPVERKAEFANHARAMLNHARDLGRIRYGDLVDEALDLTLMYVPADPVVDAAIEADPAVWERAMSDHQVLIVSPGLLLAYLKTVAVCWRQRQVERDAADLLELGSDLHERARVYFGHIIKVEKSLKNAVDAYNASARSFRSKLMPQLQKFGGGLKRPISKPRPIDSEVQRFELPTSEIEAD